MILYFKFYHSYGFMHSLSASFSVKISVNIHMNDINFKHIIEHALSCTLKTVDKDMSYKGGLRFGMFDVGCLVEATKKEDV